AALAVVRRHLEIRVPAPEAAGSAPWGSSGGHLHLTDMVHGGLTGRAATFVVGLDAQRFPGAGLQTPLLLDSDRRALDPGALETSADRLAERRFHLAALLARLRGRVTLSYAAWDPREARGVAPAAVLLQVLRVAERAPDLSFDDLYARIGTIASAVPRSEALLDANDVWLGSIAAQGRMREGVAVVRAAFPALAAGLRAQEALRGDVATAHHGLVRARPDVLDPRRNQDVILSSTRLEDLGACARRYFYRTVLRLEPPRDPELDPEHWLDALERGSVLHELYERLLSEARADAIAADEPAFEARALSLIDELADAQRALVPAPSDAVFRRERKALRADALSFVHMVRETGAGWIDLERTFGMDGEAPVPLRLPGGELRLRGRIDRIDRDGKTLRVIDYKTGRPYEFGGRSGAYRGGRRLQHALYAAVVRATTGEDVDTFEYHFPTHRGQNEVFRYGAAQLEGGLALVDRLLDAVAAGQFLPTDEPKDCKYCDFREICRVRPGGWKDQAPLAEWTRARLDELGGGGEALDVLRAIRAWEEPS
ncbi:MAG: PD-(D/E)XK nuclease family protein, partial [Longimicrobiales bacterium]